MGSGLLESVWCETFSRDAREQDTCAWEKRELEIIMQLITVRSMLPLMLASRARLPHMAADVPRWHVTVPKTYGDMADQASRCVFAAVPTTRRVIVETSTPELDPTTDQYRVTELVTFVRDIAEPLTQNGFLPASKPHCKLVFASPQDATLASAGIMSTSLPVTVLGHPQSFGPRDGAYVVIAPTLEGATIDVERALEDLLREAAGRLVVLINPRMGNTPLLSTFEPAYLMRPLSLAYLKDQYAKQLDRKTACLLRCFPHDWSVLFDASGRDEPTSWKYAGSFPREPLPQQIEEMLREAVTRHRDTPPSADS